MYTFKTILSITFCLLFTTTVTLADDSRVNEVRNKLKGDFSIMVLGSGGPMAMSSGRASAGYLVFINQEPKILLDAGGGTYQRLAESGVDVRNLDIILLTHLHIDHMGDLSPIIKTVYFHNRSFNLANGTFPPGRTAAFRIFGPATNGIGFPPILEVDASIPQYPDSTEFIHSHYDKETGNERYLNIFTRAISAGIFNVNPVDISPNWQQYNPETLVDEDGLVIKAVGVNHGPVPAVAYRIEYKGKSIVYSGDTSSRSTNANGDPLPNGGNMVELSLDADLLIYDTAIMDDAPNGPNDAIFFALHTTPSRMGEVATQSGAKNLLLSHLTLITQDRIRDIKKLIRMQGYEGKIKAAEDLQVFNLLD